MRHLNLQADNAPPRPQLDPLEQLGPGVRVFRQEKARSRLILTIENKERADGLLACGVEKGTAKLHFFGVLFQEGEVGGAGRKPQLDVIGLVDTNRGKEQNGLEAEKLTQRFLTEAARPVNWDLAPVALASGAPIL
jgi:hypothetical protein